MNREKYKLQQHVNK